jgi:phospholipid-transporting ATPase
MKFKCQLFIRDKSWNLLYHEAATSLQKRDENIQNVAELIEKNLFLIGATAIEDKLQIVTQ